jgi:tRNA threonylcarbamoyladenosine biosynthesis protein TsaE
MQAIELNLLSEAETECLGRAMAASLPRGAAVCLSGTLGAGKTRLVQAVARALGMPPGTVLSPTFTLCNEYPGDPGIEHLDLYRIADADELLEIGLEEYFASPALTFVEWADRFPESLPPERWDVAMDVTGPRSRTVQITAYGTQHEAALERLRGSWNHQANK